MIGKDVAEAYLRILYWYLPRVTEEYQETHKATNYPVGYSNLEWGSKIMLILSVQVDHKTCEKLMVK